MNTYMRTAIIMNPNSPRLNPTFEYIPLGSDKVPMPLLITGSDLQQAQRLFYQIRTGKHKIKEYRLIDCGLSGDLVLQLGLSPAKVFFIKQPESVLSIQEQRDLVSRIQVQYPDKQIIILTFSPYVLQSVSNGVFLTPNFHYTKLFRGKLRIGTGLYTSLQYMSITNINNLLLFPQYDPISDISDSRALIEHALMTCDTNQEEELLANIIPFLSVKEKINLAKRMAISKNSM